MYCHKTTWETGWVNAIVWWVLYVAYSISMRISIPNSSVYEGLAIVPFPYNNSDVEFSILSDFGKS